MGDRREERGCRWGYLLGYRGMPIGYPCSSLAYLKRKAGSGEFFYILPCRVLP